MANEHESNDKVLQALSMSKFKNDFRSVRASSPVFALYYKILETAFDYSLSELCVTPASEELVKAQQDAAARVREYKATVRANQEPMNAKEAADELKQLRNLHAKFLSMSGVVLENMAQRCTHTNPDGTSAIQDNARCASCERPAAHRPAGE